MWCDNCLLLLPLRGGAIAWGFILMLYSIAGGIFLIKWGPYLFFTYPEWQLYGGFSIFIGITALISILALSNRSYIWIRVTKFIWPFVIVISAIRGMIMLVELQRGKSNIAWECNNGGQLWTSSVIAGYQPTVSFPASFCTTGFASLYTAFVISLFVDLLFQIYMFFLCWRFSKRLEHYSDMKGPYSDVYYT